MHSRVINYAQSCDYGLICHLSDSSFMRKEFWDRQGANIASCSKEMYSEKLF